MATKNRLDGLRSTFALINAILGILLGILVVFVYIVVGQGGVITETNPTTAHVEFGIAIFILLWFTGQIAFTIWYELKG